MKRPICAILLFAIGGVLFGRYGSEHIVFFLILIIAVAMLLFVHFKQKVIFSFPVFAIIFFVLVMVQLNPKSEELEEIAKTKNNEMKITGYVSDISLSRTGRQKITVESDDIYLESEDSKKIVKGIKVYAVLQPDDFVSPGQRVMISGKIELLDTARNPGSYDEFQHLRSNGIDYKMFPDKIEKGSIKYTLSVLMSLIRMKGAIVYDNIMPTGSGIIKAMILGDKSGLSDDIRLLYQEAGIYHILAISGMHITILAALIKKLLSVAKVPKKAASIVALLFIMLYCGITGAGAATVRAVIMFSTIVFAEIFRRDLDLIASISSAALVLLLYQPLYLWDFGFMYSFAAIYGFALGQKPVDRLLEFIRKKNNNKIVERFFTLGLINKNLGSVLTAAFATYPLAVYFFYDLPMAGILNNLILVPSVTILTVFGFAALLVGFISIPAGIIVSGFVYILLNIYELVCRFSLNLPFAIILIGKPPLWLIVGVYIVYGAIIWFCAMESSGAQKEKRMGRMICFITSGVLVFSYIIYSFVPKKLNITMLDVSQGDCTVGYLNNLTFIVDGGGTPNKELGQNTGATVLLPYLDYLGVKTIQAAFVTHTDGDHASGIIELLMEKRVKKLFLPIAAINDDSELHMLLIEKANAQETEIVYLQAGDEVHLSDVIIRCLFPYADTEAEGNDASLVLKISYNEVDFMMTGDIGLDVEEQLLQNYVDNELLDCEVLKVAHHGSKYSSGEPFISAVSPIISFIGAGRNNTYGHPTPEVIERLTNANTSIFTTPKNGAIMMETNGYTINVKKMIK